MRILLLLCFALPALGTDVQQHIVGGNDTTIGQHPHVLALRLTGSYSCGASLISTTRAVTAAHCTGTALGAYSILGGTSDLTDTNCATCVLRSLTFLNRHPEFNNSAAYGYPNDVAVDGFAAVTFNSNLQAIALSTPSDGSYAGSSGTVAGWGPTSSSGGFPIILQQASFTVLTNAECADVWGALYINDGHICITDSQSSVCNGDKGSPLECSNKLAGVVSWSHAMCSPSYPSVLTRISFFYDWIIAQ